MGGKGHVHPLEELESQSALPAEHVGLHVPAMQVPLTPWNKGQALPQVPQLSTSVSKSLQTAGQRLWLATGQVLALGVLVDVTLFGVS